MPTDHVIPEHSEPTPDAAVNAPKPDPVPDHTDAATGRSQPHDEATMRTWEGLSPDAMVLAPAFTPVPMLQPDDVWAMLVVAVDIVGDTDPDRVGELALFAGTWMYTRPPADQSEGDLVVRLVHVDDAASSRRESAVGMEMLLAHGGRWQRVGCWYTINRRWPWLVAPTASAVWGLHIDATESVARFETTPPSTSPSLITWARGGIANLLDAGLVKSGDELVWERRHLGVRHTARIRSDGTLVLADGRVFANSSGAIRALSGYPASGWGSWRRTSDGRTLGELRTELHARRR